MPPSPPPASASPPAPLPKPAGPGPGPSTVPGSTEASTPSAPAAPGPKLPAVKAPAGGGALRGMSEKFLVQPATGSASFDIPVPATPGRAECTPQLSLSYSSGGANGPFGLSWALGLAHIARRTDKGLPRYDDAHDSDVFILAGAEDLVPSASAPELVGSHRVRRYRPRVEGLFARIEQWTSTANAGDVFWRVTTPENITSIFGRDADSRIASPASDGSGPGRIFAWLLSETYDARGNAISYLYKAEDGQAVDLAAANEQNRSAATRGTQRYIKAIRYGNRVPNRSIDTWELSSRPLAQIPAAEWCFELVFDYDEHDVLDPKPDDSGVWTCRRDPFSTFRQGFEVRTYRLCRRILMFHRFSAELGTAALLVGGLELIYDERPTVSFLTRAAARGFIRRDADVSLPPGPGPYFSRTLPPVDLQYSPAPSDDALARLVVNEVDINSLRSGPTGVTENYHWVDLFGEGLDGIFSSQHGGWYYKRNLSAATAVASLEDGTIRSTVSLGPLEQLADMPNADPLIEPQFMDLVGDGAIDLVEMTGPVKGFYPANRDSINEPGRFWSEFKPFASWPVDVDVNNPNLRFVDLTGDGLADILVTEDAILCYPSLGPNGFGSPHRASQSLDENMGPRVLFADAEESIYLADMSGDGTPDLCRIRNGSICYWPNIGYGKFGAKVAMDNAPIFDSDALFSHRQLLLCDIDGSGTTDLVYLGNSNTTIHFNESGNGWSPPKVLPVFLPPADTLSSITAIDLLGNGTNCLVWSSSALGDSRSSIRYIDFNNGAKPHLLTGIINNLGKETRLSYLPSTTFYLRDRASGNPWATRLPYPVQCLERVQTYDAVSRSYHTSRYAYHHGYFDPTDREFRGFGMVEQWDTEEFDFMDKHSPKDVANIDSASYVPPVLTKRWYHTGAYTDYDKLQRQYAKEYFGGAGLSDAAFEQYYTRDVLKDSIVRRQDLTAEEEREASRALKGAMLREEVYAQDGSEAAHLPYSIRDTGHNIVVVQRLGVSDVAVCYPFQREEIRYVSERALDDARIQHEMTLDVDNFGNVLKSATIWYGRTAGKTALVGKEKEIQETTKVSFTEHEYTNAIDDGIHYHNPMPSLSRTFELTGMRVSDGFTKFRPENFAENGFALVEKLEEIPYEASASDTVAQRRLTASSAIFYRKNDMTGQLKLGELESMALEGISYSLCLTPGLVSKYTRNGKNLLPNPTEVLSTQGRYVDLNDDGHWWMPTAQVFFHLDPTVKPEVELQQARRQFFTTLRVTDPFNHATSVLYDSYFLLVMSRTDAAGNTSTIEWDYRTMKPTVMTDENKNRTAFAYDSLGALVASAVMGKADQEPKVGDSLLGIQTDLPDEDIDAFFSDPLSHGGRLLGNATHRYIYDLDQFTKNRANGASPGVTATLLRENHVHDSIQGRVLVSLTYSDGYGRQIQTKELAEPDPATPTKPRWVGSKWTVFNNKGLTVRVFKPFFDDSHAFKSDFKSSISPIYIYDALARLVVVIMPNKSWTKHIYGSWETLFFDPNDTVLQNPKTDPEVMHILSKLSDEDCLPTWYDQRKDGSKGIAEQRAAEQAALHNNTPSSMDIGPMGHPFLTTIRNGGEERFTTLTIYDIMGCSKETHDAQSRLVQRNTYNMLGNYIHTESMDAGEGWALPDVLGHNIFSWNSREMRWRTEYDGLGRETSKYLQVRDEPEVLYTRGVYGETAPDAEKLNLRGELYKLYDQAGVETNAEFDFKGNLLFHTRQLAMNYSTVLDWSDIARVSLEPDVYVELKSYDALDKVVSIQTPDKSTVRYRYNEYNLIENIKVNLKGAKDAGNNPIWEAYVVGVEYNEFARPTMVFLGNGTRTEDTYDPLTERLVARNTSTPGSGSFMDIQDVEYTYDAIGCITAIRNKAQEDIFFRNSAVTPNAEYVYDPTYRLVSATGREHLGQSGGSPGAPVIPNALQGVGVSSNQPGDGSAMGRYIESYVYDSANNVIAIQHQSDDARRQGWTRRYSYDEPSLLEPGRKSNRLSSTSIQSAVERYKYDGDGGEHGCMTSMPHLSLIEWDALDQLRMTARQVVQNGMTPERTWYVYDSHGIRVRKVTERQGNEGQSGSAPRRLKERIYLGNFELYRKYAGNGATVILQSETIHINSEENRIALVEDWTGGKHLRRLIRYQVSDHLNSVAIEIDEHSALVSYEEYSPYGNTTYQMQQSERPKRYRWTSKERDRENGFYYCDARYYAPWLARWTSSDPAGIEDGLNVFAYVGGNPLAYNDPTGLGKTRAMRARRRKLGVTGRGSIKLSRAALQKWEFQRGKPVVPSFAQLAEGIRNMADAMSETMERTQLHHVYPQEEREKFAKIGIMVDHFTLAVTDEVHYLITYGSKRVKSIRAWNDVWNKMFFNAPGMYNALMANWETSTLSGKAVIEAELRLKARNVAGVIMAGYGLNPNNPDGTERWLHYNVRRKPEEVRSRLKAQNLAHDPSWSSISAVEIALRGSSRALSPSTVSTASSIPSSSSSSSSSGPGPNLASSAVSPASSVTSALSSTPSLRKTRASTKRSS